MTRLCRPCCYSLRQPHCASNQKRPDNLQARRWRSSRSCVASSLAEAQYFGQGCPPSNPQVRKPFIIGVAGGTASGKTSVCRKIIDHLLADEQDCGRGVLSVSQDCFYKNLTPAQHDAIADYNFDHPDAFDFDMISETLRSLSRGEAVDIPIYNFVTSARCAGSTRVLTTDVILFDGILALYQPEVRELLDLKIFVDTDDDTRLARRLRRDIVERGRKVLQVLDQYERTVKPSFDSYISPTKKYADIIIPRGSENDPAIDLIWYNLQFRIRQSASALTVTNNA